MARILMIDDEKTQLMLRATILRAHGYEVETAYSGAEAITLFAQQPFELVITDYMMPAMTGFDLARQLKNTAPSISIIMLTGWETFLSEDDSRRRDVDHILSKPCDTKTLIGLIESLVKSARNGKLSNLSEVGEAVSLPAPAVE
ncbi:MAG: response regulator [Acidobacteriota bacterium]